MTHIKHFIDSHFVGEVISDLSIEADFCVFEVKIQDSNTVIKVLYPQETMIPLEKGDIVDGKGKLFYLMGEAEIENGFFCPAEYIFRIHREEKRIAVQENASLKEAPQQLVSEAEIKSATSEMPPLPAFQTILKLNSSIKEEQPVSQTPVEQSPSLVESPKIEVSVYEENEKVQKEPASDSPTSVQKPEQVEGVAFKTPQLGNETPSSSTEPKKEEVVPASSTNHGETGNKTSTSSQNGKGRPVRFSSSDWSV